MHRWFTWASQQHRSILFVGLLSLIINAGVSLFVRTPQPHVHDEFSYLLAADTFAHGRLTNPTHPLWVHFESFHIIQQPTYQSKYPPGQGLMLAAGQVLGGHPMVGLWISLGLGCAAVCWMLQGWLPARWAFLGGLIVALHPKILAWWGQTLLGWGGGDARRGVGLWGPASHHASAKHTPRPTHGVRAGDPGEQPAIRGTGGKPSGGSRAVGLDGRQKRTDVRIARRRVVLPILAVLVGTAGWIGYYNFRVTDSPLRLPYEVYHATYFSAPSVHRELSEYGSSTEVTLAQKLERQRKFYLPIILTVPLLMLPWMLRRRGICLALVTCGIVVAVSVFVSRAWPHYTAPMTGLVFLLVAQGMRHLYHWRWNRKPILRPLFWAISAIYVASLALLLVQYQPEIWRMWSLERARLLYNLEHDRNHHLVIVRYRPDHRGNHEWVYNKADIDGARVVWAREMDPDHNRQLLHYFKDRRIWLLDPDAEPPILQPYPSQDNEVEQDADGKLNRRTILLRGPPSGR